LGWDELNKKLEIARLDDLQTGAQDKRTKVDEKGPGGIGCQGKTKGGKGSLVWLETVIMARGGLKPVGQKSVTPLDFPGGRKKLKKMGRTEGLMPRQLTQNRNKKKKGEGGPAEDNSGA